MTLYVVYFKHISQYVSGILNEFKPHKSDLLLNDVGREVENGFGHLNLVFRICLGFSALNLAFIL